MCEFSTIKNDENSFCKKKYIFSFFRCFVFFVVFCVIVLSRYSNKAITKAQSAKGYKIMNTQQAKVNFQSIIAAIRERDTIVYSADNDKAIKFAITFESSICKGMLSIKNDTFLAYIAMQLNTESVGKSEYCAVKVNMKLLQFLRAVGEKSSSLVDGYSMSIADNTLKNANKLTNKSASVALTKNLEYDALDSIQKIVGKMNKTIGTASTQKSSSKEAFRIFKLTDGVKNARNADIIFNDNGIKLFSELLA